MSCRCKTHLKKVCLGCGKTFEVCRYREKTAKYCSCKCAAEGTKNLKHDKNQIKVICNWCHKEFSVRGYRKDTVGYCSRKCSSLHKKLMFSGANSWNWKGGLTPEIRAFRMRTDYKNWRMAVLERDGFICQFCGEKNHLNVDHITPFAKLFRNQDWKTINDVNNGRTLCLECHKQTETYGNRKEIN